MNTEAIELLVQKKFPLIAIEPKGKKPLEKWRDVEYRDRPSIFFQGKNVGIKCGSLLPDGFYLSIMDIDARNGGFEASKCLQEELGFSVDSEPTAKWRTGGGGLHICFKTKTPLPKCKLAIGIDGQGEGSYVVGPGSIHESGNLYEWLYSEDIAEMPKELEEHWRSCAVPLFDGSDVKTHFSEVTEVTAGGRNELMTRIGGGLRRSGLDQKEIFTVLANKNQLLCKPPLEDKELASIARSCVRYEPTELLKCAVDKSESKEPSVISQPLKMKPRDSDRNIEKAFYEILESAEGLTKDIAKTILDHCDRQYPQFAIASALMIITGVSQGAYKVPAMVEGHPGGSLAQNMWLTAPSAAGKEAYRQAVAYYLDSVDERLLFDSIGSNHGLRSSLFVSNSGVSVIDEFQDELDRLTGGGSNSFVNQIISDIKQLHNELDVLKAVTLAKSKYPAIRFPRYSIFGLGTQEGFLRHLSGNLVGGGFMSRFSVFPVISISSRIFSSRIQTIPPKQLLALRHLYNMGLTDDGKRQSKEEQLEAFYSIGAGKSVRHVPQHIPHLQCQIEPTAKLLIHDFYHSQERIYKTQAAKNLAGSDMSPGSIADRAPRKALQFATIHAIGREVLTVQDADVRWGIKLAKVLSDYLCEILSGQSGDSEFDRDCSTILRACQKLTPPISKMMIRRSGISSRLVLSKVLDPRLMALLSRGDLLPVSAEMEQLALEDIEVNFQNTNKFAPKVRFAVSPDVEI